jgi:hypothetical protein
VAFNDGWITSFAIMDEASIVSSKVWVPFHMPSMSHKMPYPKGTTELIERAIRVSVKDGLRTCDALLETTTMSKDICLLIAGYTCSLLQLDDVAMTY